MKRRGSEDELLQELEFMRISDYDEYGLLMKGYNADKDDIDIEDILVDSVQRYKRYLKYLNLDDYLYIKNLIKKYIKLDLSENYKKAFAIMKEIDTNLVRALDIEERKTKKIRK